MRTVGMLTVVLGGSGAMALLSQAPPPAKTTGPGVQAAADSKEPDILKACKTPPPQARGGGAPKGGPGGGGGGAKGGPGGGARGPAQTFPRDYSVTEIPGVIAAGQKWKEVWTVEGNNADGIIGTSDGGLLIAQNDNSQVIKLDKNGKDSVAYMGLNTSGSVAMNSKGALFVVNRGVNPSVEELAPKRQPLANKLVNGDPLDCIRVVMNDITADSKGGVYFTMGGLYHADSKGVVTGYGENLNTNGIMLSADEKHLWVTNGGTLAEFDVQKDGSLTNQHEFVKLAGGGDGSTFDAAGRLYVTDSAGIEVISPDGKVLGAIPTPRGVISAAFSGPDRKMLYAVARTGNTDWIIGIPTIAQGPKGRSK
jgi:gluconolactonase